MKPHSLHAHIVGTVIAMAGTFGLSMSAQAGDVAASHYPDVVVHYGDLNIDSPLGAKVLYARLSHAAERACGGQPMLQDLTASTRYGACFDRAMDRAVQKVDKPQLQALHASRSESKVG